MSQIYKRSSGTPPPGSQITFVTDIGNQNPAVSPGQAVSSGFQIQLKARSSTLNNNQGIQTDADPNNGAVVYVEVTNRLMGTATSTDASTENLVSFALASTPSSYRFEFSVTGRDTSTGDTVGYTMFASAKTNGTTSSIVATPFVDGDEDASLIGATIDFIASSNNVIVQVTGVSSQTISYRAVGSYTVV